MSGAEPAALVESVREDTLELRGRGRDESLGSSEPLRVRQRPHGGLQLLVGEHHGVLMTRGNTRPSSAPVSAPPSAAAMFAASVVSDSSTSTAAITYTPRRSFSRSSPRRAARRS